MTEAQVPATQQDMQWANTGLEDFSVTDAVLPRIKIDHQNGLWVDNISGLQMQELHFIALGLVKQRVLFHHNVEDDDVPMCKSADFNTGYVNLEAPTKKSFPWDLSGFDPNDFPKQADGQVKLPCDGCQLKEWGSSPLGDNPYCSEQWTLPIYYDASGDGSGDWAPAILTLQKSSIKPIRTYFTGFAQSNKPPFLATGKATLTVKQRGTVVYSIPSFTKTGESPRDRWQEFSEQFAEMRSFLTRPPVREDDGSAAPAAPADNTNTAPPQQQAPAPQAPPQQAQPQQQPQQQAPPQQDPWGTPPPQPSQDLPPQQPQQQAPPPAAPAQQAPPQQAPPQQPQQTPPPAGGQGLPF